MADRMTAELRRVGLMPNCNLTVDATKVVNEAADAIDALHAELAELRMQFDALDCEADDEIAAHQETLAMLAERDAQIAGLREALTPSAETKAAYIGEFGFWLVNRSVDVPWTTVKEIMAAILKRAESRCALADREPGET